MFNGEFTRGRRYVLLTLVGNERRTRRSCMTYLGRNRYGDHQFDARPAAGTQTIRDHEVLAAEEVDPATGPEHYVNRRASGNRA